MNKLTQVLPINDDERHEINHDLFCWCDPEILEESKGRTAVHRSIRPMVSGHDLDIRKFASVDGSDFVEFKDEIVLTASQKEMYERFMKHKKEVQIGNGSFDGTSEFKFGEKGSNP